MNLQELLEFQALDTVLKRSNIALTISFPPVDDAQSARLIFAQAMQPGPFEIVREELQALASKVWEITNDAVTVLPVRINIGFRDSLTDAGLSTIDLATTQTPQLKVRVEDYAEYQELLTVAATHGGDPVIEIEWNKHLVPHLQQSPFVVEGAQQLHDSAQQAGAPVEICLALAHLWRRLVQNPGMPFCTIKVVSWTPRERGSTIAELRQFIYLQPGVEESRVPVGQEGNLPVRSGDSLSTTEETNGDLIFPGVTMDFRNWPEWKHANEAIVQASFKVAIDIRPLTISPPDTMETVFEELNDQNLKTLIRGAADRLRDLARKIERNSRNTATLLITRVYVVQDGQAGLELDQDRLQIVALMKRPGSRTFLVNLERAYKSDPSRQYLFLYTGCQWPPQNPHVFFFVRMPLEDRPLAEEVAEEAGMILSSKVPQAISITEAWDSPVSVASAASSSITFRTFAQEH